MLQNINVKYPVIFKARLRCSYCDSETSNFESPVIGDVVTEVSNEAFSRVAVN